MTQTERLVVAFWQTTAGVCFGIWKDSFAAALFVFAILAMLEIILTSSGNRKSE